MAFSHGANHFNKSGPGHRPVPSKGGKSRGDGPNRSAALAGFQQARAASTPLDQPKVPLSPSQGTPNGMC